MNKFIERAKELIARLESYDDLSSLQAAIAMETASKEDKDAYESSRNIKKTLDDALLDAQILLYEFDCKPIYEEAAKTTKVSRICYLLQKLIETAEFRKQSDD